MKLFVFRHGEAEPPRVSDFDRALTIVGRNQVARAIKAKQAALQAVAKVYVSPLLRAQQTADIAFELIGDKPVQTASWLTPDCAVAPVIEKLTPESAEGLLLVSHLPLVADLTDALCGSRPGASQFGTASLALLEGDVIAARCMNLCWLAHVS